MTIFDNIKSINFIVNLFDNNPFPLIHISKRKFYIEETNERINEFSFAYMFNPTLHTQKVFKEQVGLNI